MHCLTCRAGKLSSRDLASRMRGSTLENEAERKVNYKNHQNIPFYIEKLICLKDFFDYYLQRFTIMSYECLLRVPFKRHNKYDKN